MVTWTATVEIVNELGRPELAELEPFGQRRTGEHRSQTQQIVAHNVQGKQAPVPLLEVGHGLKCVAGKSRVRGAKANGDQPSPLGVDEDSLRGPNEKQAKDEAASDVDDQRAVGKVRGQQLGGKAAYEVAQVGPQQGPKRNPQICSHEVRFLKDFHPSSKAGSEMVGVISRGRGGSGELHRLATISTL